MRNNNDKKYLDQTIPANQRTDANPEAKRLALGIIDKYEEEKAAGKTINDVIQGDSLREELNRVEMYNRSSHSTTQLRIFGSEEHNTLRADFIDRQGNVADEIVSSNTPEQVADKESYYDEMIPLTAAPTMGPVTPGHSSVDSGIAEEEQDLEGEYLSPPINDSESSEPDMFPSPEAPQGAPQEVSEESSADDYQKDNPSDMEVDSDNKTAERSADSNVTQAMPADDAESKLEESSRKRKRDEDSDDSEQGPSKRTEVSNTNKSGSLIDDYADTSTEMPDCAGGEE